MTVEDASLNVRLRHQMISFKNLNDMDTTNDYYFLQYLGAILDYLERGCKGCLTDNGKSILSIDVSKILDKFLTYQNRTTLPQKDLTRFCLYMTFAYAICILFKGVYEVANEPASGLFNELPSGVADDFDKLHNRIDPLLETINQVLNQYVPKLNQKYRSIYDEEKNNGFIKPIFSPKIISSEHNRPSEITNAKQMK